MCARRRGPRHAILAALAAQARRETRLTAVARLSAAHNERRVFVARALENEWRVMAVRLAALALMARGLIRC